MLTHFKFRYLAASLLQDFPQKNVLSSGQTSLLNAKGYWLKGTKPKDEWGFMYDDRHDRTFANTPDTQRQIQKQQTGQFQTQAELYTFITIYLLLNTRGSRFSKCLGHIFESSQAQVDAKAYLWKLVTYVSMWGGTQRSQPVHDQMLLLFIGFTGLIAIGSWLLVQAKLKRQQN